MVNDFFSVSRDIIKCEVSGCFSHFDNNLGKGDRKEFILERKKKFVQPKYHWPWRTHRAKLWYPKVFTILLFLGRKNVSIDLGNILLKGLE
jgi:hypothetical protein